MFCLAHFVRLPAPMTWVNDRWSDDHVETVEIHCRSWVSYFSNLSPVSIFMLYDPCVAVRRTRGGKARRWRRVRSPARIRVDERRRATANREIRRQTSLSAHRHHPRDADANALSGGTLSDYIWDSIGSYCHRSDRVEFPPLQLNCVASV